MKGAMVLGLMMVWGLGLYANAKVTNMVFYIHTKNSLPNQTVVVVAGQNGDRVTVQLGTVSVGDLLLTEEQSNASKAVGRMKIMVLNADATYVAYPHAQEIMAAVIDTDLFQGSFSINGRDIASGSELAVVGGTGSFRGVKGWANFTHVEFHPPADSVTHDPPTSSVGLNFRNGKGLVSNGGLTLNGALVLRNSKNGSSQRRGADIKAAKRKLVESEEGEAELRAMSRVVRFVKYDATEVENLYGRQPFKIAGSALTEAFQIFFIGVIYLLRAQSIMGYQDSNNMYEDLK